MAGTPAEPADDFGSINYGFRMMGSDALYPFFRAKQKTP
jgi:hypothetical protein